MWTSLSLTSARVVRSFGQALDILGRRFEVNPYVESLQPSSRIVNFQGKSPVIKSNFIASSASVIGRVNIGLNSSVWYGAIIRGDINTIDIGEGVFVGDRVLIHCSGISVKAPTTIGNSVTIGPGAVIHGCTLEDECVVGAGAIIMDGAHVQKHAIVGPGAVVPPGKVVPSGQFWTGAPAALLRPLTSAEITEISKSAVAHIELATVHATESAKSWQTLEDDELELEQIEDRNEYYYRRLSAEEMSTKMAEVQGHQVPGRIFNSSVSARSD